MLIYVFIGKLVNELSVLFMSFFFLFYHVVSMYFSLCFVMCLLLLFSLICLMFDLFKCCLWFVFFVFNVLV